MLREGGQRVSKVIVLTGGASGIGAAALDRFVSGGHDVYVLDVAMAKVSTGKFIECDLARRAAIDFAVRRLPSRIDALVNVAGIPGPSPADTVVAVNFLGLRHLTESLLPRIQAGGSVVNVASSAARDWQKNASLVNAMLDTTGFDEGLAWLDDNRNAWAANPYKFSKQCVAAWTYRATGLALPRRVRVNCVNPGSTTTQLTPAFRRIVGDALYDWGVAQIGRAGTPADVAPVIEFLAIGPCPWLNGVEIMVDGGYVAGIVGGWIDTDAAPGPVTRP
jgi:NAD(P)-dependent dehydrogenase (short-subunit alcohol dehydrogenase family)